MNPFSAFVLFIVIWWVLLFAVLPFGIKSQQEDGDVVPGSERGAPAMPNIKKKFLITSAITLVIWVPLCALIITDSINIDLLPFIPKVEAG